jgi:hypothetical protein
MSRLSLQQIQRVRNQFHDRLQRFPRPRRTSRQIQNQRRSPHSADAPAERRECSFFHALTAHPLRDSIQQAVTDRPCRLRRYIARGNPRSSGCDDELYFSREPNQQILKLDQIIWNDLPLDHPKMKSLQDLSRGRPGKINPLSARTGIADCNYSSGGFSRGWRLSCRGGHLPLLPFRLRSERWRQG